MSSTQRRVVITGMGAISPLGNSTEALWEALTAGRSGVHPMAIVRPDVLSIRVAAEAKQFSGEIDDFGPLEKEQKKAIRKGLKVMCRECQMGVAAAQLALLDAGGGAGKWDPERTGISFGVDYMLSVPEEFTECIQQCVDEAGKFYFSRWGGQGLPKITPLWLLKYLPNMPASHLAIYNDLRGPNNSLTLREAAANVALGEAFHIIRRGSADAMLVGATGTRLHCMKIIHSLQQEEVAVGDGDPARISRPFDRDRTGMVLGEGAGAIMIEELSAAQARGADHLRRSDRGRVEFRGRAKTGRPSPGGHRQRASRRCCESAGEKPEDDRLHPRPRPEHAQLRHRRGPGDSRRLWRPIASPCPSWPRRASSATSAPARGMVELIASLLAMKHGHLFPTLNYETPDPECPVHVVADGGVAAGESFVNVSVTPQGQASAVSIRRF